MISKILVNGKSTIPIHHNGESPTNITVAILAKRSLTSMNPPSPRNLLYVNTYDDPPYYVGLEYLFIITKVSALAADVYFQVMPDDTGVIVHMDADVEDIIVAYQPSFAGYKTVTVSSGGFDGGTCDYTVEDGGQVGGDCIFFTRISGRKD